MSTLTITASLLNLRESPGKDARVLVQLPRGFRVVRLAASSDGTWLQVRADADAGPFTGWIASEYAAPDAAAPSAPPPAPVLTVTASSLNLRQSPAKDAPALTQLPRGTRVTRLGASGDGEWLNVRADTATGPVTGWIAAQYAAPEGAAAPAPAPAPTPAGGDGGAGKTFSWLSIARGEIGQKEIEGAKHNPRIVEYHKATSLKATDDETPWCSAFANWCMQQAGIKGTGQANARSWLEWGRKLEKPVSGCIVVLKRTSSPTSGHVGFYLETQGDRIRVLGGNQSNSVKESFYPVSDVLGYRLPA